MSTPVNNVDDLINLGIGQPDPELLPARLFHSVSVNASHLGYGDAAGDEQFRKTLASWLSVEYGQPVLPDQLMVTCGSSNGLDMICNQFARPGDTLLVEEPTYFIALKRFADQGLKVVAVPMDQEGIQPGALEEAIAQHKPALIYTIPSFQNPTGISQTSLRRQALVELVKRYQCPLVTDDVYQCLYFEQRPPPPLACYDPEAPVLSIGSFSKILAPGLRLGWIQGGGAMRQRLLDSPLLNSGGGLAPVTSALVEPIISGGQLSEHLFQLRQTLQVRRDCLHHCIETRLADRLQVNKPQGGYFLWASRTDGGKAIDGLAAAKKAGVAFLGGTLFGSSPQLATSIRLCFARYGVCDLERGCDRLVRALGQESR